MLAILWNLSAAIRRYLGFYMPTNRALDWLRTQRGLKWAIPIAFVATPSYLYAMSIAAVIAAEPELGWINVLVILFLWNALKFAWAAVLAPLASLRMITGSKGRGRFVGSLRQRRPLTSSGMNPMKQRPVGRQQAPIGDYGHC